jgi:IS30 family transposase
LAGKPSPRYIIMERRESVHILLSQNLTEIEIARKLNVDQSTISRDVRAIKKRITRDFAKY